MGRTPVLERGRRPPQAMPVPQLALGGDEQVVFRPEVKLRGATELQPMLLNDASHDRTCHDRMSPRPRMNQTSRENAGALG